MKEHVAENPMKTRRATVVGQVVVFFRRVKTAKGAVLKRFWSQRFDTHELAVAAACYWASRGKFPREA